MGGVGSFYFVSFSDHSIWFKAHNFVLSHNPPHDYATGQEQMQICWDNFFLVKKIFFFFEKFKKFRRQSEKFKWRLIELISPIYFFRWGASEELLILLNCSPDLHFALLLFALFVALRNNSAWLVHHKKIYIISYFYTPNENFDHSYGAWCQWTTLFFCVCLLICASVAEFYFLIMCGNHKLAWQKSLHACVNFASRALSFDGHQHWLTLKMRRWSC